jgi:oligopeptide/dipeptide ABC transporter ATP-binding protein
VSAVHPVEAHGPPGDAAPLLEIRDLRTYFFTSAGVVKAVDGVDLTVGRGEIIGLVGESGCGKSVTSTSVLRLVGEPGEIVGGEIRFRGENLLELPVRRMRELRGNRISMIFQQPLSSLNPVFRAGVQIAEVYELHQDLKRSVGIERAVEMLEKVGIPDPQRRARAFPHELSGGMAQRIMIAMALAAGPELLIADEPTTALDVTIQAQILDLMRQLNAELGMAVILITHDLGIVAEMCERVAVMYAGQIVEQADTPALFERPLHPYTQGLIGSVPVIGERKEWLEVIPGRVPNLIDLPPGCRFAPRCTARVEAGLTICTEQIPELVAKEPGHLVRCWLHASEASPSPEGGSVGPAWTTVAPPGGGQP